MGLGQYDASGTHVTIVIPNDTFSINMSFFLAAFGDSVRYYKTAENFFFHYSFIGPAVHLKAIGDYVQEALRYSVALPLLKRAV